jgi:alpha-beta hydrolase superfamily lysophospholipase
VDAEINSLRQQHREVNVVAHSLGGAVAIAYLSDHPQAVRKAVLIAPAVEVSDRRSPFFGARTWHSMSKRMLLFSRTTESTFPIDAHGVDDTQFPWRCPFTPLSVFEETFALIDENRGREGKFETPLLMVLSRDDQVVDWNAAERFYQSAATKEKQLFFTRDSGHAIPVDNDWRTVTSRIVEFLRDAPAPRNRSSD